MLILKSDLGLEKNYFVILKLGVAKTNGYKGNLVLWTRKKEFFIKGDFIISVFFILHASVTVKLRPEAHMDIILFNPKKTGGGA